MTLGGQGLAIAEHPDDRLPAVGIGVGEQFLGPGRDGSVMFREAKFSQSISRAKSAITPCACLIPGVRVWGCRFGQRMPPPAPPLARWAQAMWRK